jgi:hypothetical protein
MNSNCPKAGGFLRGLFWGILAGAGIFYFLNNTKEGGRLKKKLKEHGGGALESLDEIVKELEDKGEEFSQKAREVEKELEKKAKKNLPQISIEVKKGLTSLNKLRQRGQKTAKLFTHKGKPIKKKSSR